MKMAARRQTAALKWFAAFFRKAATKLVKLRNAHYHQNYESELYQTFDFWSRIHSFGGSWFSKRIEIRRT